VGIETEEIAKRLDGDYGAGDGVVLWDGLLDEDLQGFPGAAAEIGKKFTIIQEVTTKYLRNTEDEMPVGDLLEDKDSSGLFDLQLSGHKGQIFPFSLLTWLYYRHTIHAGHLRLVNDSYLYVSRGAGTWGPPMRFLSPPEITVIELVHDSGQKTNK